MARIMIADDSSVMRRIIRGLLEEAGHEVVYEAANGEQARLGYEKYRPDLVTMDITMPKMDGIEALSYILDEFPEAKIVMISALNQKSKVMAALEAGAKHYILKPVTAEKLIYVIYKVLSDKL